MFNRQTVRQADNAFVGISELDADNDTSQLPDTQAFVEAMEENIVTIDVDIAPDSIPNE
ncbi:hypothetical protein NX059_004054 [Plenodomus lindquistii]|nr:hypothetical protein NX059_004054 [Plenodomus lindquistii]